MHGGGVRVVLLPGKWIFKTGTFPANTVVLYQQQNLVNFFLSLSRSALISRLVDLFYQKCRTRRVVDAFARGWRLERQSPKTDSDSRSELPWAATKHSGHKSTTQHSSKGRTVLSFLEAGYTSKLWFDSARKTLASTACLYPACPVSIAFGSTSASNHLRPHLRLHFHLQTRPSMSRPLAH